MTFEQENQAVRSLAHCSRVFYTNCRQNVKGRLENSMNLQDLLDAEWVGYKGAETEFKPGH